MGSLTGQARRVLVEPEDRRAIDRLKQDQEYRDRIDRQRARLWNKTFVAASVLAAGVGFASLGFQLLHLL